MERARGDILSAAKGVVLGLKTSKEEESVRARREGKAGRAHRVIMSRNACSWSSCAATFSSRSRTCFSLRSRNARCAARFWSLRFWAERAQSISKALASTSSRSRRRDPHLVGVQAGSTAALALTIFVWVWNNFSDGFRRNKSGLRQGTHHLSRQTLQLHGHRHQLGGPASCSTERGNVPSSKSSFLPFFFLPRLLAALTGAASSSCGGDSESSSGDEGGGVDWCRCRP